MKVTMYKANDGSLHDTQKLCDAKNVELRTAPLVEDFVNGLTMENFIIAGDDPITEGAYIDVKDLPGFIVKHADALRTLLNKAVNPVGRPRKNSTEAKPRRARVAKVAPAPAEDAPKTDAVAKVAASVAAAGGLDDILAEIG